MMNFISIKEMLNEIIKHFKNLGGKYLYIYLMWILLAIRAFRIFYLFYILFFYYLKCPFLESKFLDIATIILNIKDILYSNY